MKLQPNDIFGGVVVAISALLFIGGIFLFFWENNGWYLIGPVLALILFAAG